MIPPGTGLDAHGYPLNREVLPRLLDALARPDLNLVFGHFNESDTVGHDHGPESDAARECYAATDAVVGQVLEATAARWDETVVVIVSDHDMQARNHTEPIDLMAARNRYWDLFVPDGGAALVHLQNGVDPSTAGLALGAVDGVETWQPGGPSMLIAGAKPGRIFAAPKYPAEGFHGAPITARTVALVGGGHPRVPALAAALEARRPHLADWAPTLTPLLGLELEAADGRSVLG
jgi:arylsulfatase A-like enzyme